MSRPASWAPGLLALRSARHLLWLLDYHTRPTTAEHTRPTAAGPAAGRRPAAVEIATTSPPAGIRARLSRSS